MNTMSHKDIWCIFVEKNLEELKRMQAVVEEEEDAMKFIPLGKDFHYHY
jgi:2'-5' RNA ligase